jgi:hypothetical protein
MQCVHVYNINKNSTSDNIIDGDNQSCLNYDKLSLWSCDDVDDLTLMHSWLLKLTISCDVRLLSGQQQCTTTASHA